MPQEPQQFFDGGAVPGGARTARFKKGAGGRRSPAPQRRQDGVVDDAAEPETGESLWKGAVRSGVEKGSIAEGVRSAATRGALGYAAKKIKESEQGEAGSGAYGSVLKVAGDAVGAMQKKHQEDGHLDLKSAAQVSKDAAVQHAGKAVKRGAQQKVADLIARHPELAAHAGELLNAETKNLDLTGKGADKLAQAAATKGLKSMAQSGGQQFANQALPGVGSISARDAVSGVTTGAKKLSQGNIAGAAKSVVGGITKSVLVSGFRFSYQWSTVGASFGFSLIATAILGTLLLFLPNRGVTFLEKLLVVALDVLFLIIIIIILAIFVVLTCNSSIGWSVWAASYFSNTASTVNAICAQIPGSLQSLGN